MSDDTLTIEVDGKPVQARKGQMLIEVTDTVGVYVPRFCYHEKLTIAANCRMCLVEVEKAPKPLPACATPVADGMKVFTRSPKAIAAQRATMEFLLINHPLDCPICDQGGECELQDQAMGFGRGVSRYTERKRVVKDKNLGPLVSTDMTRCIHCTRCVRFTQEIAGHQELGTVGRGESTEIGTYVERSVQHELSGNIIDLCPVGALNNKPYRYGARAWEMTQHETVAPHDCIGSNIHAHVLRGTVRRVVPRANEAVNETWISDRDRFSYQGLYAQDRLRQPMMRRGDGWVAVDWEQALSHAAAQMSAALGNDGDNLGVLCSPSATLEEMHLLARITRHLGSANMEHRLRQRDTRDQSADPAYPSLGVTLAEVETAGAVLVVGSNLRREAPIFAHRVRKAAIGGAAAGFVNPERYDYLFPVAASFTGEAMAAELAALVSAAAEHAGKPVPGHLARAAGEAGVTDAHRAMAKALAEGEGALITLGLIALRHPAWSDLRALAAGLASLTDATLGQLSEGANSAGAALAGLLPHRGVGGQPLERPGRGLHDMLEAPRKAYLLFGLEPDADVACPDLAIRALESADFNVAFTAYDTPALRRSCHLLLPIGTFAETSGTFVNVEGRWQGFNGAARPVGDARPGWKVLRVLGNMLQLPQCEYVSSHELRDELERQLGGAAPAGPYTGAFEAGVDNGEDGDTILDVPMYSVDAVVRRATALQQTRIAREDARRAAEPPRAANA